MSSVKAAFKCSDVFKEKFEDSTCLLTISVGQEVHEREKFEATVNMVADSFGSCIMLIDDSLQRHTMALTEENGDGESFYEKSIKEGDLWLERNKKFYEKLTNLKAILRWDYFLKHKNYQEQLLKIKNLMESDAEYKNICDSSIQEFLTRYYSRLSESESFDKQRGYSLCLDYLLEECTAICLWTELNCQFEVYPSKRNAIMDATHKRLVIPRNPDLLHAVSIKFKNRRQLMPQKFSTIKKSDFEDYSDPVVA